MQFERIIKPQIEALFFQSLVLVVYGPRRVGKTTLVKRIQQGFSGPSIYLNCDEPDIREALSEKTSTQLSHLIGDKNLVIIDEAQRVKNIGLTLKLIVDNYPQIQVLATGSSSFELSNRIAEPLTGRHRDFFLHPLSMEELLHAYTPPELQRLLENRLLYGSYPQIVTHPDTALQTLVTLTNDYLYKDALEYQGLRNADVLRKLVQALAFQIGHEVSYTELATMVGIDKKTVEHYVRILELAFIVFRLSPFSRNLRKELSKTRKIYFWDCGVRNAVINNFNALSVRHDTGELWENYLIAERLKYLQNHAISTNTYFWRTYDQQEIDLVEEASGRLRGFEIKWKKPRKKAPKAWVDSYPQASWQSMTAETYLPFVS